MLKGHHLRASSVALLCGTAIAVASCGTTNNSPTNSPAVNGSPANSPAVNDSQASPSSDDSGYALEPNAVVIRVIDGDTIEADIGGNRQLVRFIGIDTPEKTGGYLPAECFGDIASTRTRELIPAGTPLHLKRDTELYDRYDRLLAYIYRAVDGLMVNHDLLVGGYAAAMRFEPNVTYAEQFASAAAEARTTDLGLWGQCGGPDTRLH